MRISDWSSDVCSSDLSFGSLWDAWREKNAGVWKGPLPLTYPPVVDRVGADNPLRRPEIVNCCAKRRAQHRRRMDEESSFRSEEHTSELQSLMRISYAVFCLKKKKKSSI